MIEEIKTKVSSFLSDAVNGVDSSDEFVRFMNTLDKHAYDFAGCVYTIYEKYYAGMISWSQAVKEIDEEVKRYGMET